MDVRTRSLFEYSRNAHKVKELFKCVNSEASCAFDPAVCVRRHESLSRKVAQHGANPQSKSQFGLQPRQGH